MALTVLIAVLSFITLAGLGFAFSGGGSSAKAVKRAQGFAGGTDKRRGKEAKSPQTGEARRRQIMAQLREAEKRDRKVRVTIAAKLRQAGLTMDTRSFWILSATVGLVICAVAFLTGQKPYVALGLGFAGGLGLPQWTLGFLAAGRIKKFTGEFANAVDVIVRGIKSGLPVHECFRIIGREFAAPLGPEFQRLIENIGMGMTPEQALEKMYERMPTPELRFFCIVIGIQARTGGNLAEALSNLSAVLRSRKLMREKVKALSSEATASAMIIGCLPPAVIILVTLTTPSYMMILFQDIRGHLMLLAGGVWMALGIFVMKRMISFKI